MHTVAVDIAIQGDLAKAPASHFHTVVPFHDLLTIWFSYGQNLWNSAFRILVYSIRFPCLCIHRLSLFGRETRPFLFSKNYLFLGATIASSTTLFFLKQRKHLRCVRDSNPWPPAWLPMKESNFLNCHLTTSPTRRHYWIEQQSTRYGSYDFWNGLLHYTGRYSNQLN